jgi:hypothetical protein
MPGPSGNKRLHPDDLDEDVKRSKLRKTLDIDHHEEREIRMREIKVNTDHHTYAESTDLRAG